MPNKGNTYLNQQNALNKLKADDIVAELPSYCKDFEKDLATANSSPRTILAYADDLRFFFNYLIANNSVLASKGIKNISLEDLENLTVADFNEYVECLQYGILDAEKLRHTKRTELTIVYRDAALSRKISAVRSFFRYLFNNDYLSKNVSQKLRLPKLATHEVIALDAAQIASLLDETENADNLTDRQQKFHEHTKLRDLALLSFMVGTGVRVSEVVALDIDDINLEETSFIAHRKENKTMELYFSDEVAETLRPYYRLRQEEIAEAEAERKQGSKKPVERAMFTSLRGTRLSVRSVERLVTKYSAAAEGVKKISAHKLRSSYATGLYKETGDIYLVGNNLGHDSIRTTQRYTQEDKETRRQARNIFKLRRD